MILISFNDGVTVELHEDLSIEVLSESLEDVEFNISIEDETRVFNAINNRLGGILTP